MTKIEELEDEVEDRELAEEIMKKVTKLRRKIDAVGNSRIRQQMDEYLCRVWLLARDGHEKNLNGGS